MNKYPIDNSATLRDVYHMWLVAVDPKEFARENDLTPEQLSKFRTLDLLTWGEFDKARKDFNE